VKKILLFVLLPFTLCFAQEGKVVQSEKLSADWEYYKSWMNINGYYLKYPVQKNRTGFLTEKYVSDMSSERDNFLYRYTYRFKNQLYEFIVAKRGTISEEVLRNELTRDGAREEQETKLKEILKTAEQRGEMRLKKSLVYVKFGMSAVIARTRYRILKDANAKVSYMVIYILRGYQKESGSSEETRKEIIKNSEYIMKNVDFE